MSNAPQRLTVIRPHRGWFDIDWRAIWESRDLIYIFARRDVTVKYKQTILGPLWLLVQPLTLTFALTKVMSGLVGISTDDHPAPVFYMVALVLWGLFSSTVTATAGTFTDHNEIFEKVYFPRLVVPISALASCLVGTLIQIALAVVFLLYYQSSGLTEGVTWRLLLLPLVLLQLSVFAFAVGLWIAVTTAKYRDVSYATPLLMQLWMFATPIIYAFSAIPEEYRTLVAFLNPLSIFIEQGRWCFLGTFSAEPLAILVANLVSITLFAGGVLVFYRVERRAMDTL